MTEHKGLPVSGYQPQSEAKVALVNEFKQDEERLLRKIDDLFAHERAPLRFEGREVFQPDGRWLSVAQTHFQQGFMALNRAVFQPTRIALPEDAKE